MSIRVVSLSILTAAVLAPSLALAQAPPDAKPPVAPRTEQSDPKACSPSDRVTVGQSGDIDINPKPGQNLSERLAQTGGVICPPANTDPEIRQPTPQGGRMPVIPPPGSPGGDPTVQPK